MPLTIPGLGFTDERGGHRLGADPVGGVVHVNAVVPSYDVAFCEENPEMGTIIAAHLPNPEPVAGLLCA